MRISKLEPWFIFFGSLALFLYGLFGRELIGFETRFAVFTQELLRLGPHFFPTTYGEPYPDYPAGLPSINALFVLMFGKFSTLAAILPSACISAASLVLLYQLMVPLNRQWARIAVLLMLFTYEFFDAARSLTMDPFILFASLWAFFLIVRNNHCRFLWLCLPLIFGFAIRGPIGLIMPGAAVVAHLIANKNWSALKNFCLRACGLLCALLVVLLLAARYQGGSFFVKDVLFMQIFGRLEDHRSHNFFAYFTDSFANYAISFELALTTIILCWEEFKSKTPAATLLKSSIYWALFILVGMSIPEVRKIRYILPMTPALAILGAYLWISMKKSAKKAIQVFYILCLSLPFIGLILTLAVAIVVNLKGYNVTAHFFSSYCTLTLLAIFCVWIFFHQPFYYASRNPKRIIGIGLASFIILIVFIIKPIEVNFNHIQPFVKKVMNVHPDNTPLVFYRLGKDAEPIQFMSVFMKETPPAVFFVESVDAQKFPHSLYLTKASTFDTLPEEEKLNLQVVLRDKLGHRDMVVFIVNTP